MKELLESEQVPGIIGFIAGILTAISMLPQLIRTIKEKKADEISPLMLIVLLCGVSLWLVYGILKNDMPIIISNALSLLLNITMLFLRWKYK